MPVTLIYTKAEESVCLTRESLELPVGYDQFFLHIILIKDHSFIDSFVSSWNVNLCITLYTCVVYSNLTVKKIRSCRKYYYLLLEMNVFEAPDLYCRNRIIHFGLTT